MPSFSGRDWLTAIVVFLIALVVRVPCRSHMAFDWDCAQFALAIGQYDLAKGLPHPPGYFLYVMLGKLVNVFVGEPHAALVWMSVVCGSALAAVMYLLGAAMFGRAAGGIAALVGVSSPLAPARVSASAIRRAAPPRPDGGARPRRSRTPCAIAAGRRASGGDIRDRRPRARRSGCLRGAGHTLRTGRGRPRAASSTARPPGSRPSPGPTRPGAARRAPAGCRRRKRGSAAHRARPSRNGCAAGKAATSSSRPC